MNLFNKPKRAEGEPHCLATIIKAWADGERVQYAADGVSWEDYPMSGQPPSDAGMPWRVKPSDPVRYRVALMTYQPSADKAWPRYYAATVDTASSVNEKTNGFVRWLGDWQEAQP